MRNTGKTNLPSEDEESTAEVIRRLEAKKIAIKNRPAQPGKKLVTKKRKPKTSQVGFAKNRKKSAA